MGADGEAEGDGRLHSLAHDVRITGVEPTRDVGRRDVRQKSHVVTEAVGPERLADVRIQIDRNRATHPETTM
jgi:hypothetical protein